MNFSPDEITTLRQVKDALIGVDAVLIGAAALREFGFCRWRSTFDLDLTVALGIGDHPGPLDTLIELRRDKDVEHRWHLGRVKLDIIPAGATLLAQGHVQWHDRRMSLAGQHLAFSHAVNRILAPDFVMRVAPPAVIAVLKMISYCERPAERERDLGDFAELLEKYIDDSDDRRFDDHILKETLSWEDVSPHELGRDVSRIMTSEERPWIEDFLTRARGEESQGMLARLLRVASFSRDDREARVLQQLAAFARGLGLDVRNQ